MYRVVRHRAAADGPFDVTDKFRIDIFVEKKLIGRKQILSSLHKRKSTNEVGIRITYLVALSQVLPSHMQEEDKRGLNILQTRVNNYSR